jgi:hypothetical protein
MGVDVTVQDTALNQASARRDLATWFHPSGEAADASQGAEFGTARNTRVWSDMVPIVFDHDRPEPGAIVHDSIALSAEALKFRIGTFAKSS